MTRGELYLYLLWKPRDKPFVSLRACSALPGSVGTHKYITPQQTFIFFLWQNLHRFLWPSWPNVHKCVKIFLSWKIYCGVGCWQRPWRFLHQLKGWIPASEERADGRWWDGAQESGHETNNHPPDSRLAVVDRALNEGSWRLREDITNMEQKAPTTHLRHYRC